MTMRFAKAGLLQRLLAPHGHHAWQALFLGRVGRRGLSLTREIDHCIDCTKQRLMVNGGAFVSPKLDLFYMVNEGSRAFALGLKLEYEHYISGDISSAVWVSGLVELM